MSDHRQRYSSSPLYGLKNARRRPGGAAMPAEEAIAAQQRARRGRSDGFLQLCMSLLLPVFFIVALIMRRTELHWAFLALSALCLAVMWLGRSFVPQARTTLSLIYIALIIISLAAALWFTTPLRGGGQDKTTGGGASDLAGLFGRDVTSRQIDSVADSLGAAVNQLDQIPNTPPTPDARSEAQSQLELFMSCWMNLDYNGMLTYCLPSWVSAQAEPEHEIFKLRANRTPLSFEIESVSGDASDDSRTLTMRATIDRANLKEPVDCRFEILMLRVNGTWYVAPQSLSSGIVIVPTATATTFYTLAPTATPAPGTMLYFNPDGGSYYHLDENCSRVAAKYKPLKGSFQYSQRNDSAYAKLEPCSGCNTPAR